MAFDESIWPAARAAWDRLATWRHAPESAPSAARGSAGLPGSAASTPAPGDAALDALRDIGTVRRLLDEAELAAVRAARAGRRSWSEIATMLGISRQSAWERWRDLDEGNRPGTPDLPVPVPAPVPALVAATHGESTRERMMASAAEAVLDVGRRRRRRQRMLTVPNLVGVLWPRARAELIELELLAAPAEGAAELDEADRAGMRVRSQAPESGARVPAGSRVLLWLSAEDGGSAGVREPRRPRPQPRAGRALPSELDSDAVG